MPEPGARIANPREKTITRADWQSALRGIAWSHNINIATATTVRSTFS